MRFGQESAPEIAFQQGDSPADALKRIARQRGGSLEDWHFKLLGSIPEAHKVYFWFMPAKLMGNKLYYDGSKRGGALCYDWVRNHFQREMGCALGNVEVCLAKERVVVKSFDVRPDAPPAVKEPTP